MNMKNGAYIIRLLFLFNLLLFLCLGSRGSTTRSSSWSSTGSDCNATTGRDGSQLLPSGSNQLSYVLSFHTGQQQFNPVIVSICSNCKSKNQKKNDHFSEKDKDLITGKGKHNVEREKRDYQIRGCASSPRR